MNQNSISREKIEAFGREIGAIHQRVRGELGERDTRYIQRVVGLQRGLEVAGRSLLYLAFFPPAWLVGVACLSLSKIIENMEAGHNIMHGQYDFSNKPGLSGESYEWDSVCPADQWRHSHNYLHHTLTNVRGVDHDLGYRMLRVTEEQPWRLHCVIQPLYAAALAVLFQWGVAVHDTDFGAWLLAKKGARSEEETEKLKGVARKAGRQLLKDYLLFPLLGGPLFVQVLVGNLVANLIRNVWAFTVIFCGHFPSGTATFSVDSLENETREHFYYRQLLGSANFEGGGLLHFLSGHLSHQIEHHLFPDIPAHRYPELALEVRAICRKYQLPYNTGSLAGQFWSVVRKLARLSWPSSPQALSTESA